MGQQTIALLFGRVDADAPEDEKDVLVQVQAVRDALQSLGYATEDVALTLDLGDAAERLRSLSPALVFNLAETINGKGSLIHVGPSLLESLEIPYTGAPAEAIFLTSHKLLSKRMLAAFGIDTPAWTTAEAALGSEPSFAPPFIVKSVWEHASIGMADSAVAFTADELSAEIRRRTACERADHLFVEHYIEGREFNLALLAMDGEAAPSPGMGGRRGAMDGEAAPSPGMGGRRGAMDGQENSSIPRGLPPAEIRFLGYPEGKPRFVGYRAKWDEGSFEFSSTPRSFDFAPEDAPLLANLARLSQRCWEIFGLRGYARVDFRVDAEGRPWVLEVNTNPCLSPDAGFMAAAGRAGLSRDDVVRCIVQDSWKNVTGWARPARDMKEPNTWAPR
jgi:D-alanine-D-alanine ligase